VPLGASRLIEFAGFRLLAAERVRLAVLFASGFVQALAELAVLSFHFGQATNQAMILPLEGLLFLSQHSQASAQEQQFPITILAASTHTQGTTRGHGDLHELCAARGKVDP
jgi:hypothetical protein